MKKCNRFLSFLLAFVLVITTFGSDITSTRSYALSSEEAVEEGIVPSVVFESTDNEAEDNDDAELPEEDEPETVAEQDITVGEGETIAEENAEPAVEEAKADGEEDADAEDDEEEEDAEGEGEEALDPEAEEDAEAVEDAEAEDAEKKETKEEKKVVEKEFREAVEIDGIKISLYAEPGVIPADAELEVEKVESDDEEQIQDLIDGELGEEFTVKKTYSYDINIVSSETGKKYNPEDNDTVEVRFSQVVEAAPSDISMEVYHVNDALTEAESVSDVVEKGTSITFDAEHFSIYAVTLYFHEKAAKVSFNAGVYDINGNEITTGNTIRKVEMGTTSDLYYNILPKDVAPIINGYTFVKATINDQQIKSFYTGSDNAFAEVEGATSLVVVSSTDDEPVKFFYKNTGATTYQTSNHIDLGFTDDEMPTVQYAKVTINKKPYNMTNGIDESDLGVQEKRLSLPQGTLRTVYSSDEIIFTVGVKVGAQTKEYTHVCTEAENKNAYERCKNAHTYRQNDFGFDYKFNFAVDFNYGASVTYHSNFGNDQTKTYPVTWTTQTEGTQETHKVVTYAETKLPERTGYEFQGWADATGKLVYSYNNSKFTPATFKISNNEQVNLYASWKSKERETRNAYFYVLLPNESTNVPKDSSPQSTSRFYPAEGTNYHIWSGKGYKDIAAEDKDKNGNVYDISGVTTAKYIKQYDDGVTGKMTSYLKTTYGQDSGLTYQDIVWYTYKNANDNAGWHFDGYVKDVPVKVTYYRNISTTDQTKKEFTVKTGGYVIKDVTDTTINYSNPGYTFDYWTTNANGTGDKYYANEPITLRSNLKLYAHWTKIPTYTVTYNDGVADKVIFADQVTPNLLAGADTPGFNRYKNGKDLLDRPGYTFAGWDPEVADTVTESVTYVAQWTRIPYTVTYNDGVADKVIFTDQVNNNLTYGDETPEFDRYDGQKDRLSRPGYTFAGWDPEVSDTVTGSVTYVAQWTRIPYTVTYNDGVADKVIFTDQVNSDLTYGDETPEFDRYDGQKDRLSRPGYTFEGWNPEVSDTVTASVTYVAQWNRTPYTVTYNDGVADKVIFADQVNSDLTYGDETPEFDRYDGQKDRLDRPGYTFEGWNPEVDDTVTGSVTYVAQWTRIPYTVTYNDGVADEIIFADQVNSDLTYGDETPEFDRYDGQKDRLDRPGYTFQGWDPEVDDTVTGSVTYVAQWNRIPYTVTYNDGVADEIIFADQVNSDLTYGDETPEFDRYDGQKDRLDRPGYTFQGWDPEVDDTVTASVTYVAQWTRIPYTVTYNDGVADEIIFADQVNSDLTYGDDTPEFDRYDGQKDRLDRPGYTFAGWDPEVDDTVTASVTYIAQWTRIPYTVTYTDGVAGEVVFVDQVTNNLTYGDPTPGFNRYVNGKDQLSRDGFEFKEWSPAVKTTVDGSITYEATWTPLYSVTYKDGVGGAVFTDQENKGLHLNDSTPAFEGGDEDGNPVREDYDFMGWEASQGSSWSSIVLGNEVYTATWKYQYANYTVNWYLRGATAPTKIQDSDTRSDVKIGEKAYATADDKDVSKLGNKFVGLEYDTTSVDNVVVDENGTAQINLYFKKVAYTVTYEYRDADDIANKSALPNNGQGITQNYNDTVNCAAAASAQGYEFVGWKFAENYGEYKKDTLVPETFSMPAENVVIYGTFSPASGTVYYVEHWTEKAEGNGYEKYGDTVTKTGTTGQPAGYSEYSITGFSYVGAYVGDKKPANVATEENTKIKADGTLTIKLYYDRNSYPVVYSYASDSIIPEGAMDLLPQGGNYKFGTTVEVEPTPYIAGYKFIGWKGTYNVFRDIYVRAVSERDLRGGLMLVVDLIIEKITGESGEKLVFEMPPARVDMVGHFEYDNAAYTVNYYLQNEALNGYDKQTDATETVTDLKTNDQAVYEVKDFGAAYSYKETQVGGNVITDDTTIKVLPDGSLVIDVYYDRVFKTVTYKYIGTAPEEANEFLPNAGEAISYWVGSEVTVADVVLLDAYEFFGWDAETEDQSALEIVDGKFNMPDTNVVFSGSFEIKKFTVTYNFKNTDGTAAEPKKFENIEYGKNVPTYSVTESQIPEGTYFDGWLDEEGNLLQNESIARDVVKKNREYVAQYRIPHKTTINVVAETEGGDVDTYLPYNGGKQFAELKLKLDVQVEVNDTVITSTEDSIFGTLSSLFGKALSFGSITATAENGEATLSEDVTIRVDGEDVTYRVEVDVLAGQGKDVNDDGYPTTVTDIRVTANGEDASEQFDINLKKGDTVGHLYVTPAPLKIKTYGKTFVYTGHPFTYDKIDVTGFQKDADTNLIETATSHATGSITSVGRVQNTYSLDFDQTAKSTNYEVVDEDLGWLIVTREQKEEEPPHDPETPEEVPETPGQVLGAQRAPEGQVLGARRGGTEDSANMVGRIITIVVAAGIGFTMIFLKRKKKEDEQ